MKSTATFVFSILLVLSACSKTSDSNSKGHLLSENEAVAAVSALPETKAWTKYIEKQTGGRVKAVYIVEPVRPKDIKKSAYWSVGFYESDSEKVHRWETFLVRMDGKEVLIDDEILSGGRLSLEQWRKRDNPMGRVGG